MNAADIPTYDNAHVSSQMRLLQYAATFSFLTVRLVIRAHMEVIPVIDLKDGAVVHARMGMRSAYAPIKTPLSPTSRPTDVARGLLSIFPFKKFYVADLNAIEHKGDNNAALKQLSAEYPDLVFWVDAGIADVHDAGRWLEAGLGHLVLGSETQRDSELVHHLCRNERTILSLDFRGDQFLGPVSLLNDANTWPAKIIVMALARVGSASGPDMSRLTTIKSRVVGHQVYAAGGVRDANDLALLARAGIAGALVATSLHNGKLTGAQIAHPSGL
jgi:phosphoribosylformimino-5-aminoimidazole carboxamide ribotide isomerase